MEKMRKTFADPILVRSRSGWTATSAAVGIHISVQETLQKIDAMASSTTSAPGLSKRRFRVAATDYGALVALGPLVRSVSAQAPFMGFDVEAFSTSTFGRLERGELDFAFYADDSLPGDFHYRDLFVDRYVVVMSRDHPLASRSCVTVAEVENYPRAVVRYPSLEVYKDDDPIGQFGTATSRATLRTPFFSVAPMIAAGTQVVVCLPKRVANIVAERPGPLVRPYLEPAIHFTYRVIWHDRIHRDPTFAWVRDQLMSACKIVR